MISRLRALLLLLLLAAFAPSLRAQTAVPTEAAVLRTEGLRSTNHQGAFRGAVRLPDDTLVLLYDQEDGLRLLRTDRRAQTILSEAHQGSAGDHGLAITTDPAGNIYVAGTSFGGTLTGTPGAAYPASVDASSNPFVAAFDANLQSTFLTFLGAGHSSVTGIAATKDAVFITGSTFSSSFPASSGSLQTAAPADVLSGAGYVASFSTVGGGLRYATFLDGLTGGSTPTAITAESSDVVYIAGSTADPTFPSVAALEPVMAGPVSGFFCKLAADGQSLLFSTFIPGDGLSSVALDSASDTLLATGDLAPGKFPILRANAAISAIPYQSLLRLSTDGQTVRSSVLLAPGTQSFVTPGPGGTAWVTGELSIPLGPLWQKHGSGDAFLFHLTADDQIDQAVRLGGNATSNAAFATLSTTLAAPVLSADATRITVPGTVQASTAPSLRSAQAFDLAFTPGISTLLPNDVVDLLPTTCPSGSDCSGSAGLLAQFELTTAQASLTLDTGDLPNITVRNTGPVPAMALSVTGSGLAIDSNCPQSLAALSQCTAKLGGSTSGTITVASTSAATLTSPVVLPASSAPPLAFGLAELDFGVVTASASPATRTITVSNLSSSPQAFSSAPDALLTGAPFTLSEIGSTCAGPATAHILAAQATCTVTVGLSASPLPKNDGPVSAFWRLGTRELPVTGFTQAATLSVSAAGIDFGPQPATNTPRTPRTVFLSNAGPDPISHTTVSLPASSPFAVLDGCPSALAPGSVCPLTLTYAPPGTPTFDTATLSLDQGLSVVITGEVLPVAASSISASAPLAATPDALTFASPVQVTQQSKETQTLRLENTSAAPVPISISVLGDFLLNNRCPAMLAPQAICSVSLSFAPTQPGTRLGLVLVTTLPGALPTSVPLSGSATPLFTSNNGTFDLGSTTVLEPTTAWLQIQGSFSALSATVSAPDVRVAFLAGDGAGHGTLPASAFSQTVSAACIQCWLAVQYTPQQPGVLATTLQLSSGNGQSTALALTGTAVAASGLVLTPPLGTMPATSVGSTSAPVTLTLTNLTSTAFPVSRSQIVTTGDFSVVAQQPTEPACSGTLQPTASCPIQVAFTPSQSGLRTGSLTVASSSGSVTARLQAVATPAGSALGTPAATSPTSLVTLFPTQADFGPQPIGALSLLRQFQLTNASASTLNIRLSASQNFVLAQASPCPSLPSHSSCVFSVGFAPETAGLLTGAVTVSAVAPGSAASTQTMLYLRGFGTSEGRLSVDAGLDPMHPADFGSVLSGDTAGRILTLTNAGSTPLNVRRLTSTTPFHLSTDCTRTLGSAESCNVTLTYAAVNQLASSALQVSRTDRGTLLIESDADASPTSVYLTGTALPSPADPGAQANALPVFSLSAGALTSPNTAPGTTSTAQSVTLTNSGSVPIRLLALLPPDAYTASSNCGTVQPQATCDISLTFTPGQNTPSPSVSALGVVTDGATALEYVSLLGVSSASVFKLDPDSLSFAPTALGSSTRQTGTLTNTTLLPISLSVTPPSGDFAFMPGECGTAAQIALLAGQSCTFSVVFTPTLAGARSATLTVTGDSPATTRALPLQGTGLAGTLQASPASVDFGNVPLTTSAFSSVTLSNSGNAPLGPLAFSPSGSGASAFAFTSACPDAGLAPGASCTVRLQFTPAGAGTSTASLSVASTDPSSPLQILLTGTGTEPPGFSLSVNGASTASAAIASGETARFPLTLAAQGGYAGRVNLTCTAISPARNATFSLADTTLTLEGQTSTSSASLTTLSGISSAASALLLPLAGLLFRPHRSRKGRRLASAMILAGFGMLALCAGCGHGPGYAGNPYTPPGTYTYQITATAQTGNPISSSVTLSVTVH